ncbi:MAG: CoA transferase [Actinomycetota bacterium]|nr:CoA transferase [Actinomycetota bacterium]MEC8976761.1 CoA transferase [Actinomycetota bacterium]MEC9270029.1 CoA transferase [Actinomycetota bacterium]MEC9339239.1 CoA transferase [Actinomycetota bacterium]
MAEEEQELMLDGVHIVDFSQYLAGAGVTRMLAEMGADITKIEIGPIGDGGRLLPFMKDNRSGFFIQHNRGKKSVALNWEHSEAIEIARDLAIQADIVLENFGTADTLKRRGLDYESIRALNPGVIYLSVSAFGRTGPWANKPGFDFIAQAASGLMHMAGSPDEPPGVTWSAIADNNAAVHGFAGLGYALYHRERTGQGQFLDLSMVDCLFHHHEIALQAWHLSGGDFVPKRMGRHHELVFPVGLFQGPESWIAMLALDFQWGNVCRAMNRPDLIDDPLYAEMSERTKRRDELIPMIEEWMSTFETDQALLEHLEEHRVPASPVLSPVDAIDHPHFNAREMVRWVDDPIHGSLPIPGFPWKFSAQKELPELTAPLLGEHNVEVLTTKLGYDTEQIEKLKVAGVLIENST